MSNASTHERIHAMDSLRAIMMMLGLVLHSAITYGVYDYRGGWSLKDPNATSYSMDWLVSFIHIYRMPLFFLVAGFFGALLFYKRGAQKMIKNRLTRILYPFLVFLFLLAPLINFSFSFTWTTFDSNTGWETVNGMLPTFSSYLPKSTFHLWFLYYLLMITLISFGVGLLFGKMPIVRKNILNVFNPIAHQPFLKLFVFSGLTFIMLYLMDDTWVATSIAFQPDIKTLIFYSYFYLFGWILYKSRQPLEQLVQYDWLFTILGLVLLTGKFLISSQLGTELVMALNSILVWLFSFGITGLFIRYGSNHSHIMRYISDASYWFYLLHLPLTAFLPGMIAGWNLPAEIKFLFVMTISTLICWFTYHYFIRSGFIGKFLNGRRYSRSLRIVEEKKLIKAA
jgi:peptidoglycan/LPS O-acetylase OafA/YrhL